MRAKIVIKRIVEYTVYTNMDREAFAEITESQDGIELSNHVDFDERNMTDAEYEIVELSNDEPTKSEIEDANLSQHEKG